MISVDAFLDELEKIAAGPAKINPETVPGPMGQVLRSGQAGGYLPPKHIGMYPPDVQTALRTQMGNKHGLIHTPGVAAARNIIQQTDRAIPGFARYRDAVGLGPETTAKLLRRHEMTHWMRDRRGLLPTVTPGNFTFGNAVRLAREETAANLSAMRAIKNPLGKAVHLMATPGNVGMSVGMMGLQNATPKVQQGVMGAVRGVGRAIHGVSRFARGVLR